MGSLRPKPNNCVWCWVCSKLPGAWLQETAAAAAVLALLPCCCCRFQAQQVHVSRMTVPLLYRPVAEHQGSTCRVSTSCDKSEGCMDSRIAMLTAAMSDIIHHSTDYNNTLKLEPLAHHSPPPPPSPTPCPLPTCKAQKAVPRPARCCQGPQEPPCPQLLSRLFPASQHSSSPPSHCLVQHSSPCWCACHALSAEAVADVEQRQEGHGEQHHKSAAAEDGLQASSLLCSSDAGQVTACCICEAPAGCADRVHELQQLLNEAVDG